MQRTEGDAPTALTVGLLGRRERALAIDIDEGVQAIVERCDAVEIGGDDFARRYRASREQLRELHQRLPRQIGFHSVPPPSLRRGCPAHLHLALEVELP